MFEARLEESLIFKKIIDSIKDLVKNVNININSKGFYIQAMDTCHVALVALQLKEKAFSYYNCQKPIILGLAIQNVVKILRLAANDDILTLSCQTDPSTVKFKFQSKKGDKMSSFDLNLINLDSQSLGIPDTQFLSVCSMPSNQFQHICRQLGILSQTIKIQTNKNFLKFSVAGQLGTGSIVISKKQSGGDSQEVLLDIDEPLSLSFASRYLNMFTKAGGLSNQVVLNMSNEAPLMVEYKLSNNKGEIKYYLAPKIAQDQ